MKDKNDRIFKPSEIILDYIKEQKKQRGLTTDNNFDYNKLLKLSEEINKPLVPISIAPSVFDNMLFKKTSLMSGKGKVYLEIDDGLRIKLGNSQDKHCKFLHRMFNQERGEFEIRFSVKSLVEEFKNPNKLYLEYINQKEYLKRTVMEAVYSKMRLAKIKKPQSILKLKFDDQQKICWIETQ